MIYFINRPKTRRRMDAREELDSLLRDPRRKLVVSEVNVDLVGLDGPNVLYLLVMPDSRGSAGGRAGGFGQRSIEKVYCFRYEKGRCEKLFETDSDEKLSEFEIPPGIARLPAILIDGTEEMVYGIVDPETILAFNGIAGL